MNGRCLTALPRRVCGEIARRVESAIWPHTRRRWVGPYLAVRFGRISANFVIIAFIRFNDLSELL